MRRNRLASLALLTAVVLPGAAPAHADGPLPPRYYCAKSACVLLGVETDGSSATISASCSWGTAQCVYLRKTVPPVAAR